MTAWHRNPGKPQVLALPPFSALVCLLSFMMRKELSSRPGLLGEAKGTSGQGIQLFGACRVLPPFCLTSALEALYKALLGHCSRKQDHSRVGGFWVQRTSWGQVGCWNATHMLMGSTQRPAGQATSGMFHRNLQGDSYRREGLSQVLISSPPQMSTLAHLSSHLCFHCPPSPGTEKNTCSSQPGVHREPHLTPPSLAGPGPSAHSPQGLAYCGFGTCTSVPVASDSLVLAVPLLSRVCVLRGSEHLFDPVGGLSVRIHVESMPVGAQSFPSE